MLKAENVLKDKEYIIFDLDDTLIDSYENHKQGIWEVVKEYNLSSNNYQDILETMEEVGRSRMPRRAIYSAYIDEDPSEIDRVYWRGVGRFILAYKDAIDFVEFSKSMLKKKLSILSNGGEVQQKKFDLVKEVFGDVFGQMVYTGQMGQEYYKPDTRLLEHMMKLSLVKRELSPEDKKRFVYIGDRLDTDFEMCKNCEIDFVLIDRKDRVKEKVDCLKIKSFEELICIQ